MAHPNLRRPSAHRAITMVGIAGAALFLPIAPVGALALAPASVDVPAVVCDIAVEAPSDLCNSLEGAVDGVEALVEAAGATGPVAGLVEQLPVDVTPEDLIPVDLLPADEAEESSGSGGSTEEGGQVAPPVAPGSGSAPQAADPPSTTASDSEPAKVGAAGKNTTEVAEPQAPASDGRIVAGPAVPTIQPNTNLGVNIPSVRSQSGLTLQPYEAPIVSIPMEYDAPQVAAPTMTTAAPVQAAAAEAIRFTGETLVPYTTGPAAWVTATGLGLLGAAGATMRRRLTNLTVTTLEQ